jgi:hypothetical protein
MTAIENSSNIPASVYVNIESKTLSGGAIREENLAARCFTTNSLLPTNSYINFDRASEVGVYFGTNSEEYKRALFYFSYSTPSLFLSPTLITFARWADVDVAPLIFGAPVTVPVSTFNGIGDGAFMLEMDSTNHLISGLDFSSAVSYTQMASVIMAAIQTFLADPQFATATVTFNSVRGSFDLVGGSATPATISTSVSGIGTDILESIGWEAGVNTILSDGVTAQTITQVLEGSVNSSSNLASYLFMPVLTLAQATESAQWLSTYLPNNSFYYSLPVQLVNVTQYSSVFNGIYPYVVMTVSDKVGEYPEMLPMALTDSTDYDTASGVSYSKISTNLTPSVTSLSLLQELNALGVNFVGRTQEFGTSKIWWQAGWISYLEDTPASLNVFVNELWLKSEFLRTYTELLATNDSPITADPQGAAAVHTVMQQTIDKAVANRVIVRGRVLSGLEKQRISAITRDPEAWRDIQNIGYWSNVTVKLSSGIWVAFPVLIYESSQEIRKVTGLNIILE